MFLRSLGDRTTYRKLAPAALAAGFIAEVWGLIWLVSMQQPAGIARGTGSEALAMLPLQVQVPAWALILVGAATTIGLGGFTLLILRRDRQLNSKEREARLAEQRLIDAIEAIPDGFAIFDRDDRLIVFNEAYKRIYAESAPAIVAGASFESILRYGAERGQYPAAIGRVEAWLDERLQAHRTPTGPFEQELPDGRWLHIEERCTEAGDVVGIRSDITELKQREIRLARQAALLTTTFEHMSGGVSVTDEDGCLMAMNRELQRLLGLPDGFVDTGIPLADALDFVCAKDRAFDGHEVEDIGDVVRRIVAGSRERHAYISDNGLTLEISGSPLPGGGHVITYADVTAQHATLARLQASEAQKSAIIAAAIDAVVIADERGRVIEFNQAAESLFGYSSEEAVGRPLKDLIIPPHLRKAHAKAFQHFLETGEKKIIDQRVEVPAMDKLGRIFPVEITISATKLGRKHIFSAYMRDISEQKRAEEAREAAREAAEAANRAKTDFLAMISHELRTPMNGIIGLGSLLLDSDLGEEQRRFARGIETSATHLLNLINEILDFSRIEAGRIDIKPHAFRLANLVESVVDTTAILVRDKPITVRAEIDPQLPAVLIGDAGRLQQVLQNLLGNSAKFTEAGNIELHVTSAGCQGGRHRLRFTVKDTGIGIAKSMMSRLFEPFEQGDVATGQQHGGTGLGLAITHRLVALLAGRITVQSEFGKGSIFEVVLDLDEGQLPEDSDAPDASSRLERKASRSTPRRILVAEDTPASQLVVRTMLERNGHFVRLASNGKDALEALGSASYDLVILDLQMPVMDGWETLAAIRGLPGRNGRLPAIALTAQATPADKAKALAAGFDQHIAKPIRPADLMSAVDELVAASEARGATPASADHDGIGEAASGCEAVSPTADVAVLDSAVLTELKEAVGDKLFAELVDAFLKDAAQGLREMSQMLQTRDSQGIKRHAHRLTGLLGQFGCNGAARAFAAIENAADPIHDAQNVSRAINAGEVAVRQLGVVGKSNT